MLQIGKHFKENLTVPNLLSVLRILLIVPFVFFFLQKNYIASAAMLVLSGLSDMFDGMIARRFNQITALGKILDPIADKLTLVAVIICIGMIVPRIIPLVVILVLKDLLMLLGGAYLLRKHITPPAAKWYGKLATVVFFNNLNVTPGGQQFCRKAGCTGQHGNAQRHVCALKNRNLGAGLFHSGSFKMI